MAVRSPKHAAPLPLTIAESDDAVTQVFTRHRIAQSPPVAHRVEPLLEMNRNQRAQTDNSTTISAPPATRSLLPPTDVTAPRAAHADAGSFTQLLHEATPNLFTFPTHQDVAIQTQANASINLFEPKRPHPTFRRLIRRALHSDWKISYHADGTPNLAPPEDCYSVLHLSKRHGVALTAAEIGHLLLKFAETREQSGHNLPCFGGDLARRLGVGREPAELNALDEDEAHYSCLFQKHKRNSKSHQHDRLCAAIGFNEADVRDLVTVTQTRGGLLLIDALSATAFAIAHPDHGGQAGRWSAAQLLRAEIENRFSPRPFDLRQL